MARPKCSVRDHEWWVILIVTPGKLERREVTLDVECTLCKYLGKVGNLTREERSSGVRSRWYDNSRVKDIRKA